MSLKTGSRIDAWSDLRVLDTNLTVTEKRIRVVKKLSRWEVRTKDQKNSLCTVPEIVFSLIITYNPIQLHHFQKTGIK